MFDIFDEIRDEMKEVYLKDQKPIIVAFSGGKDSSLVLTLLWQMLEELPLEQRTKTVHVIVADTGVETPAMTDYIHRTVTKIQRYAERGTKTSNGPLPIKTHLVRPQLKNSFWYKVLGKGTLVPTGNVRHRWCTAHLKIIPTQKVIQDIIRQSPVSIGEEATLWLGVRNEESARRRASISEHELSPESKWARHSDFESVLCYHPIKFVTSDEVFFYLLELGRLPYGVDVEDLVVQYGEGILECGMKTSNDQGISCGAAGNRQGCWTCGLVNGNDPMLLRHVEEGKEDYRYLLEWKNLMLSMRNDIRYREILPRPQLKKKLKEMVKDQEKMNQLCLFDTEETKYEHRYETFKRAIYEEYTPGAMTVEGRRILLEYLLYIQEKTGYTLISEIEILVVLNCWQETDGITVHRHELIPRKYEYDGELIFLPNKQINIAKTKNKNPVFYITIELNMEEGDLFAFLKKRQIATGKSYFFFPAVQDFKEEGVVWNKATFIICKEGINDQLQAAEEIYKWLGWYYGHFTEETKKAAINHLILNALSEGITNRKKRNKIEQDYQTFIREQENGQLSLII
jgi:DNA sulfur modification protein DndC